MSKPLNDKRIKDNKRALLALRKKANFNLRPTIKMIIDDVEHNVTININLLMDNIDVNAIELRTKQERRKSKNKYEERKQNIS